MLSVTNLHNKTKKDVLDEMNQIWKTLKRQVVNVNNFFNVTVKNHKELYEAYPTVLKHMIFENKYNEQAFSMYLEKLQKKPWLSDIERLKSYTEYYVILYKKTHRWTRREIMKVKSDYFNMLKKEHEDFISRYESTKKKIDDKEINREKEHLSILIEQFKDLSQKSNIEPEKIKKVINMALSGKVSSEYLESLNFQLYMDRL